MNCILARTLFYAQKNGYGNVSYSAKIVHDYNIQKHHLSCHSLQDVFLFSTYFWERLRHNFEYACDVADKVTFSWKKKDCCHYLLFQTNFKAKCKWLIPICMHCHWSAAVSNNYPARACAARGKAIVLSVCRCRCRCR